MRIKEIKIEGLFDMFNHTITLRDDTKLTIIYGENGIGKTMVFKILEYFFNFNINKLYRTPFTKLIINFINNTIIELEKGKEKNKNFLLVKINGESYNIYVNEINKKKGTSHGKLTELIQIGTPLRRVGYEQFLDTASGVMISLDEAIEKYGDVLPDNILNGKIEIPEKLSQIIKNTNLYFIQTQRLLSLQSKNSRNRQMYMFDDESYTVYENTATNYSNEISKKIKEKTDNYRKLSDDLKNSLSNRILNNKVKTDFSIDELQQLVQEADEKRRKYIEAGLIEDSRENFEIPDDIGELNKAILAVNIQDMLTQLKIYEEDNFYNRLQLFIEILNNRRLSHKSIKISEQHGFTFTNDKGKELKPENLSSGEQHELVLLYQLLFKIPENSLILIDEPEISLHITWQKEFTNDMEDIIKLRNFDILLATHSPAIINGNWEITQSLDGYEEE